MRLGVLELTALPSIGEDLWVPMVWETGVLLVNGGVCYWMRQFGLVESAYKPVVLERRCNTST